MLPPGFERKVVTFISSSLASDEYDVSSLPRVQGNVLELVRRRSKVGLRELEKKLGKKRVQTVISKLVGLGLAVRSYEPEPIKIRPRVESYLSLTVSVDEAYQEVAKSHEKRTARQATLLDFLAQRFSVFLVTHSVFPHLEFRPSSLSIG